MRVATLDTFTIARTLDMTARRRIAFKSPTLDCVGTMKGLTLANVHASAAMSRVNWSLLQSRSTTVHGPTCTTWSEMGPAPASRIPCEKICGLFSSSFWTMTFPDSRV